MEVKTEYDVGDTIFYEGLNKKVQETIVHSIEIHCSIRDKDTVTVNYVTPGNVRLSPRKVFPTKESLKLKLIRDITEE